MIAIKMDMPKCCDDCWALDDYGDYPSCLITQETRGYNFKTAEKRMDKCPLIECIGIIRCEDCEYFTLDEHLGIGTCDRARWFYRLRKPNDFCSEAKGKKNDRN